MLERQYWKRLVWLKIQSNTQEFLFLRQNYIQGFKQKNILKVRMNTAALTVRTVKNSFNCQKKKIAENVVTKQQFIKLILWETFKIILHLWHTTIFIIKYHLCFAKREAEGKNTVSSAVSNKNYFKFSNFSNYSICPWLIM